MKTPPKIPARFKFRHLRHTGLTELGESDATAAEIMAISGHTNMGTLSVYVRGTETMAEQAMAKREAKRSQKKLEENSDDC